ncbi:MAG TPA: sulfatase-like hydrolase/transferase [bacterium]|nr:sulfatase-like hydrolase/transferase [bacterium]
MNGDGTGKLDRRRFLAGAAAVTAGAAGCAGRRAGKRCPASPAVFSLTRQRPALADLTGGRQPNILFILTDQERYAGNLPPTLKRPNFERLAANAVNFRNTFCAYPLCSPSRSAILSGKYPHQTGVLQNVIFPVGTNELPNDQPQIGSVLAAAGYRIGYKGKWDLSRGPTYYRMNLKDRGNAGDYGFEGHCGKVPDQEYGMNADGQVVDMSCEWIKGQQKGKPWFLCCSIINPHDICHPQLKPDQTIRPDAVLPSSLHDDLKNKPADQRQMRDSTIAHFNQVIHPGAKPFNQYNERDWKLFLSFYYDLIELTDRYVGRLFAALEDTGQLDDTIIVYSSDHGELGGAHGFSGKYEGYEEDLHIPLYLCHPALERREITALTSNVSIAPSIAALAGAKWPAPIPGRDLSAWLTGQAGPAPEAVFSETETNVNYGLYKRVMATRMARAGRWKFSYSFHDVSDGQLYDLAADPMEMNNLFHDPAHAAERRELAAMMRAWQRETGDHLELPKDI